MNIFQKAKKSGTAFDMNLCLYIGSRLLDKTLELKELKEIAGDEDGFNCYMAKVEAELKIPIVEQEIARVCYEAISLGKEG